MTTREILVAARALIEDESRWTQTVFARTPSADECDWHSPDACRWCAAGAVYRAAGKESGDAVDWALDRLAGATNLLDEPVEDACDMVDAIATVNDHRGHAATLAMFDEAIAACG